MDEYPVVCLFVQGGLLWSLFLTDNSEGALTTHRLAVSLAYVTSEIPD